MQEQILLKQQNTQALEKYTVNDLKIGKFISLYELRFSLFSFSHSVIPYTRKKAASKLIILIFFIKKRRIANKLV